MLRTRHLKNCLETNMTPKQKLVFGLQQISGSYFDGFFNQNKKTDELHDACDKAIWMIVEKNYSKSYVCKSLSKKNKLVSQNGLKSALNDILPDYVKKISYGVQQAKFFRKLEKCS